MKSFLFAALIATVFVLPFAHADSPQTLRFGAIVPLSGDFAPYGQHIREGIELAQTTLRRQGIEVKVQFEDACLAPAALRGVEKLLNVDRIQALVGSYCVIGIIPTLPLLERAQVLTFQTSEVPRELLAKSKFAFSSNARIEDEAMAIARHAIGDLGLKRFAVLGLETQWGREFMDTFRIAVEKLGGDIVATESVALGDNDFRSELTRFRRVSPDAVFFAHVGAPLGNALAQARSLGLKATFLTVSEAEEQSLIQSARESSEGLELVVPEPNDESLEMREFQKRFVSEFGHPPHPLARHSYDNTMLSAQALLRCSGDRVCARDSLASTKSYSGASGLITIDADRGTSRGFSHKQVKNGRFVTSSQKPGLPETALLSLKGESIYYQISRDVYENLPTALAQTRLSE